MSSLSFGFQAAGKLAKFYEVMISPVYGTGSRKLLLTSYFSPHPCPLAKSPPQLLPSPYPAVPSNSPPTQPLPFPTLTAPANSPPQQPLPRREAARRPSASLLTKKKKKNHASGDKSQTRSATAICCPRALYADIPDYSFGFFCAMIAEKFAFKSPLGRLLMKTCFRL